MLKNILPCLLIFFVFFPAQAQDYIANVQHFGLEEGLSHREVFCIHQDSRGFIWVGTKYGLNRFDGYNFKWYTKEKNGLASNEIHHILEDGKGFLWVFTVNNWFYQNNPLHLSLVNIYTDEVLSLEERFGESLPFTFEEIIGFTSTGNQLFFHTRSDDLYMYNATDGFREIPVPFEEGFTMHYLSAEGTFCVSPHSEDGLSSKLVEISVSGEIVQTHDLSEEGKMRIRILHQDQEQGLWLSLFNEKNDFPLFYLDRKESKIHSYAEAVKSMFDYQVNEWGPMMAYRKNDASFWLKNAPDFYIFHPKKGLLFDFGKAFPEVVANDIHHIYFDKKGIAWLGTANGLYLLELKENPFDRYLYMDYDEYNVNDAYSCRGIGERSGQLFVNSYKGRIQIDLAKKIIKPLGLSYGTDPIGREVPLMFIPLAIMQDHQHRLWFGEHSLVRRDFFEEKEAAFFWEESDYNIWSIYEDEHHQIWVGKNPGLGRVDTTQSLIWPVPPYPGFEALSKAVVHAFVPTAAGHVWLATTTGLYSWKPDEGVLNRYWSGGEGRQFIPFDNVLHVHEDQSGILWLATGGGGLIRLDTSLAQAGELHWKQFTVADGLSNNNLYAVYGDDFEQLWMSSDYGIIQFDKNTYRAKAFLPKDGLTHHEFNRISHFQADDGKLYFGGLNGVTAFYPRDVTQREEEFKAPLQITEFQQFDGRSGQLVEKTAELLQNNKIIVRPGGQFFRLEFALLDYSNTDQIRFAYQLEGLDRDWHYIHENFLRISGVPYGQYTLKIKGQGADGRWSEQMLSIPLVSVKPFYFRTWFIILVLLLTIFGSLAFFRRRTALLRQRKAKLEKLVRERTLELQKDKQTIEQQAEELRNLDKVKSRFFTNVSHELRTPLSLILGPAASLLKQNRASQTEYSLLKTIKSNAQQLLQLVNEILDLAKLESGKLSVHPRPVVLHRWLCRILNTYKAHAEYQNIQFHVDFLAQSDLQIELDTEKFEKILRNLLSNAFKFTPEKGRIDVRLEDSGQTLRLTVSDTGRGVDPEDLPHIFDRFYQSKSPHAAQKGGTGIGLALSLEYAKLLNARLWAESPGPEGKGSTFYLEFPKNVVVRISEKRLRPAVGTEIRKKSESDITKKRLFVHMETVLDEQASGSKPLVLLVEDNPDLRKYIQFLLRPYYQVVSAENGKKALGLLQPMADQSERTNSDQSPGNSLMPAFPDLIISDIMMPVMDGFQLLTRLKSSDRYRHIPVIMLTARAATQDKLQALRIGVDDYMIKPFVEEELLARAANLLSRAKERAAFQQQLKPDPLSEDNTETRPTLSAANADWLKDQEVLLQKELSNAQFAAAQWAYTINISERQLQRKIKQLTGLTPYQYLLEMRLMEARRLMEIGQFDSLSSLATSIGFANLQTFTRNFKKRFGKIPSEYI